MTIRFMLGLFSLCYLWLNTLFLPAAWVPQRGFGSILSLQTKTGYTLVVIAPFAAGLFLVWHVVAAQTRMRRREWAVGMARLVGVVVLVHLIVVAVSSIACIAPPVTEFVSGRPLSGETLGALLEIVLNMLAWPFRMFFLVAPITAAVVFGAAVFLRERFSDSGDVGETLDLAMSAMVILMLGVMLLGSGPARPNSRNRQNLTALMIAAEWGEVDGVRTLIASGADVNVRTDPRYSGSPMTALDYAVYSGGKREAVSRVLREAGGIPGKASTPN